MYLIENFQNDQGLDQETIEQIAYDQARKEFYKYRLERDVEREVCKEEALHWGARFSPSDIQNALKYEDKSFEDWRQFAQTNVEEMRQRRQGMFSGGTGVVADDEDSSDPFKSSPSQDPWDELSDAQNAVGNQAHTQPLSPGPVDA